MSRWLFVKFRRQLCPGGGGGVLKHVLTRLGGDDEVMVLVMVMIMIMMVIGSI